MRNFKGDAVKVAASLAAGFMGVPALIVLALVLAFCAGKRSERGSAKIEALRDTIRLTDSVAVVRTDTVTHWQRRVDTVKVKLAEIDTAVTIRDDSTVLVHDTVSVIPPLVISDIRSLRATVAVQDTLILSLYRRDTTRLWQLATRDKMIRELTDRRRCGRRCGLVIGFTVGVLLHKAAR